MIEIPPGTWWLLTIATLVYLAVMYFIAFLAQRRITSPEEFLLAGRRLPLSLAWMTLLATWFGAGTLLTVADEVRHEGLQAATLDPLGAGCCLLFVACFVAAPMWRMQIATVADFFRIKYGRGAELLSAIILVPSYFGWIAAQFTALAGILNLFWSIPMELGLVLVAVFGTGYTWMGGMWSVTWTDAVQVLLLIAGLLVLCGVMLWQVGSGELWHGLQRIGQSTPPEQLILIPTDSLRAFLGWLDVFLIGSLGNVAVQDLMQRVFASNSAKTAARACGIAGAAYLTLGSLPILLALGTAALLPEYSGRSVLPALAQSFLHPAVAVIFVLALLSAILSTIDSAILSPASVIALNFVRSSDGRRLLRWNRLAVMAVAGCSLLVALAGKSAYSLLEESYTITLVGLFVPLMFGLSLSRPRPMAGMVSMLVGSVVWSIHFVAGWEVFWPGWFDAWQLPVASTSTVLAAISYAVVHCIRR